MEKEKVHIPNQESVLQWIEKGFVPSYMIPVYKEEELGGKIPPSGWWYDIKMIDNNTGTEYYKVGNKDDAKDFFDDYINTL